MKKFDPDGKKHKAFDPIAYAKKVMQRAMKKTKSYNKVLNDAKRKESQTKKDGTPSKRYRVYYRCATCNNDSFTRQQIQVDHIHPTGLASDLEEWIRNLYCDATGLQVLCIECHKIKTKDDIKRIKEYKNGRSVKESVVESD